MQILPAPFKVRRNVSLPGRENARSAVERVLMVCQWEILSRYRLSFRQMAWALQSKAILESVGKACRWKHPRAPSVRPLF